MLPGLTSLVHPHAASEVIASLARNQPYVLHGAHDVTATLSRIPFLASLDALLGAWPAQVSVHLPDVADEASSVSASPHDARKMFAAGMSLLFDEVQLHAPALLPWLDALRGALGVSTLTQQRCLVYATPAGKGTAAHFDHNVNFVLQLSGDKTWWLAPNAHVQRPMSRHTMGLPVDPELSSYARLPMPDTLPAERTEVRLTAGSLLVVPRGTWHATHATTDALSLNFTFTPPTWIDLFSAALRGRLALSAAWRQSAEPLEFARFDELLRELAADAAHWNATDILSATEGPPEDE